MGSPSSPTPRPARTPAYNNLSDTVTVTEDDDDEGLYASALTETSAVLTLANHTGSWYYRQALPSVGQCSSAVSSETTTVSDLTRGTSYTFKAYSNVNCSTELTTAHTDAEFTTLLLPDAPASVTVTRANGKVNVTWPSAANATGYNVQLSYDDKATWTRVASNTSATTLSITDTVLNTNAYVAVQSVNNDGISAWTDAAPAGPAPPHQPDTVTGVWDKQAETLTLSWNDVATALTYNVRVSYDNRNTWTTVVSETSETTITLTDATLNVMAYAGVQSVNSNGTSAWTESAAIDTTERPPEATASVTVTWPDETTMVVTWEEATKAPRLRRDHPRTAQGLQTGRHLRAGNHPHRHRRGHDRCRRRRSGVGQRGRQERRHMEWRHPSDPGARRAGFGLHGLGGRETDRHLACGGEGAHLRSEHPRTEHRLERGRRGRGGNDHHHHRRRHHRRDTRGGPGGQHHREERLDQVRAHQPHRAAPRSGLRQRGLGKRETGRQLDRSEPGRRIPRLGPRTPHQLETGGHQRSGDLLQHQRRGQQRRPVGGGAVGQLGRDQHARLRPAGRPFATARIARHAGFGDRGLEERDPGHQLGRGSPRHRLQRQRQHRPAGHLDAGRRKRLRNHPRRDRHRRRLGSPRAGPVGQLGRDQRVDHLRRRSTRRTPRPPPRLR